LRTAFPLGSLLSGGLDSSSITCTARHLLAGEKGQKLLTFSAIFDKVTECDERKFINAILAENGLEPHYVYGDKLGPLTDLDRVLWHQDEAFYSPNLFLNWGLYISAKENGVRVLLDGFDGDTTVSHGVGYLNELANEGRWFNLGREIWGYARNFNLSSRKLFWSYMWRYRLDPVISKSRSIKLATRIFRAFRRRVLHSSNGSAKLPAWSASLNPDFVRRIGLIERRKSLLNGRASTPKTERENHHRILTWGVMPFTLEVLDKAAAAFAIEPRFPFWDMRLAEFCLALPPEQKMHHGITRMVLRRALEGVLPSEVQWRFSKSNLGPNFDHGLLVYERECLDDVIMNNPEVIEKYVNITALRDAYRRFLSRETIDDDVLLIWKAVSLALWIYRTELTSEWQERGTYTEF
jgi:asparagine synthase (glutamine-hydrolysing)